MSVVRARVPPTSGRDVSCSGCIENVGAVASKVGAVASNVGAIASNVGAVASNVVAVASTQGHEEVSLNVFSSSLPPAPISLSLSLVLPSFIYIHTWYFFFHVTFCIGCNDARPTD